MPVPDTDRKRVYDAVKAAVESSTFVRVRFVAAPGAPAPLMEMGDDEDPVQPTSVVLDEVQGSFAQARRNRQTMTYERAEWLWELHLGFAVAVSLEDLQRRFTDRGLVIPSDRSLGLQQITVTLRNVPYFHPPQGQPANGTLARLTLQAQVGPK